MSLLNQMLKDLLKQNSQPKFELAPAVAKIYPFEFSFNWKAWLISISSIIILGICFVSVYMRQLPQKNVPLFIPLSIMPSVPHFPNIESEPLVSYESELTAAPKFITQEEVITDEPEFDVKVSDKFSMDNIKYYLQSGNWQMAISMLDEGLMQDPSNLNFAQLKARILSEQGAYQDALTVLESFNPSIRTHPDFYALEAAIYETLGRTEEAGGIYQTLLKLDPSNGQYWLGLGIALENKKAIQQAIEAYQQANQSEHTTSYIRTYAAERLKILQG